MRPAILMVLRWAAGNQEFKNSNCVCNYCCSDYLTFIHFDDYVLKFTFYPLSSMSVIFLLVFYLTNILYCLLYAKSWFKHLINSNYFN